MTALTTLAQYHMNYGGDHMDGGWGWGMIVLMVLLAAALIAVIVLVVRSVQAPRADAAPAAPSPQEILDRRLAAGEITPDDYRQRLAVLGGS